MNNEKKAMFIQNMTHLALSHAASSPNVAHPDGKMSHDKMAGFIAQMTKQGLQHFAEGGTALGGPTAAGNTPAAAQPQGLIGGISNILGTNNNFQASSANIQQGTNASQLNNSYNGVQDALKQQQGVLGQQQGLTDTLTGQANQGANTQNTLTNMLTERANGGGPNPAQAQLNQNTGQNIAQQAALAAGQRGAGANAGLIARQNAQQGAATQQNAVGQAATLNANQQIAAQNQLQSLAGTQVGQGQGALNSLSGAANAYGQAQQHEQGILQNANTAANNASVAMQSNINNVNSGVSAGNQAQNNNILGGVAGAISGASAMNAASKAALARGGVVKKYDDGGWVDDAVSTAGPSVEATQGPNLKQTDLNEAGNDLGGAIKDRFKTVDAPKTEANFKQPELGSQFAGKAPGLGFVGSYLMASGGKVDNGGVEAMVSPKEKYLSPDAVKKVLAGADPMKLGVTIPGKATVRGDSLKNDTVKTTLQEGGVVIPRHITTHKMASEKAAEFVRRAAAKKGSR